MATGPQQHRCPETDRVTPKEKSKWTKRTQCSAINCKNYQCNSTNLAFHRFPKDPDRCARWVQNLGNASLMGISSQRLHHNYRVCSAHFHASQFKRPSNVHAGLKWDAVPTMVNAPNPPLPLDLKLKRKPPKTRQELPPKRRKKSNIVYLPNARSSTADSVQHPTGSETDITSPDASVARPSMPLTPLLPPMSLPTGLETAAREHALKMKIRSLKVQVCKLKAEVNRLKKTRKACVNKESVMKQLKKFLPAKTYAFVSSQIHMFQRKARGFRWTTQDKAFFLSLLHASPKCYRLLFKVFSMPSVRTLQKLMKSIDIEKTIGEHGYAAVTTDSRVDETGTGYADPPVTANVEVKAEQVEQPIDYTLDNQFDSHQISSFSSGDCES